MTLCTMGLHRCDFAVFVSIDSALVFAYGAHMTTWCDDTTNKSYVKVKVKVARALLQNRH